MPTFLEVLNQTNGGNIWWLTMYLLIILVPITITFTVSYNAVFSRSMRPMTEKVKKSLNIATTISIVLILIAQAAYILYYL